MYDQGQILESITENGSSVLQPAGNQEGFWPLLVPAATSSDNTVAGSAEQVCNQSDESKPSSSVSQKLLEASYNIANNGVTGRTEMCHSRRRLWSL
jgi:hypothetical protein